MITTLVAPSPAVVARASCPLDGDSSPALHASHPSNQPTFTRQSGKGPFHIILLPGLVPDGPETFLRQAHTLRRHGSTAVVTYPYADFHLDILITAVEDEITSAVAAGRRPVLVGVSVGGGFALEVLRRARAAGRTLPLAAVLLISPFTCAGDLSPLLRRLYDGIVGEQDRGAEGDPAAALERGRAFFKTLAGRSAPARATVGRLRSLFQLFTPHGLAELSERRLRARIEKTLNAIPAQGAIARTMALRQLPGIAGGPRGQGPLSTVPTLILWGSKERHTLDMDGPGTSLLCRPDLAYRLFSDCEVHWVYGDNGDEVPHASLLKHHQPFNRLIGGFLGRIGRRHSTFAGFARWAPLRAAGAI